MTGEKEITVTFEEPHEGSIKKVFEDWAKMYGCPVCNPIKREDNPNWFEYFNCHCQNKEPNIIDLVNLMPSKYYCNSQCFNELKDITKKYNFSVITAKQK